MLRAHSLDNMVPSMPTEGTILATGVLADAEIEQCVREALDDRDVIYPVPGHPPMHPDEDFVPLVRISYSRSTFLHFLVYHPDA